MSKGYEKIVKHYERCYAEHGDNHKGMDWPKLEDNHVRFQVMLQLLDWDIRHQGSSRLLDFGCGTAHLLAFIQENNLPIDAYIGLDYSQLFVDRCLEKFPTHRFIAGDVLHQDFVWPEFDYAVMNGVFTEKRELSHAEMWDYFTEVISKAFHHAQRGIAFNTMSKNVDWERDDLFHVSMDELSSFLSKNLSRNIVIRQDYGLYEFTTYLYK